MALPKKKISLVNIDSGTDRIEELSALTNEHSTFLPKSILLADLDRGFTEFVKDSHLKIESRGKEVPAFFLVKEKWAEFSMTWQYSDDEGNILMPFITIRRSEAPKAGTNENIKWRVAQNKKFTYLRIPTFENGVQGMDIYKMPQPVPVDLTFEVRMFTHFMKDLNTINEKIQSTFASGQAYTNVKGYFIPIMLDSVSDESTMNEMDGKRFYCQVFTFKMQGFLQNENDFEVVKGIRRLVVNISTNDKT